MNLSYCPFASRIPVSVAMRMLLLVALTYAFANTGRAEDVLRAGIVGCDTSHVVAFTKLINSPAATGSLAKVRVVAAYPGGSPDIPASRDRVETFTAQLKAMGVEIVDALDELSAKCDVFLLESVDGRVHLEQFRAIAQGKPVFIDKPAAASLAEVLAIFALADKTSTPCFSSSALRYCHQVQQLQQDTQIGDVLGVATSCPYQIESHHPDLFWYGIHGVESLYALMGPGCRQVSCVEGEQECAAVGLWDDGRCGIFRGLKVGPPGQASYTFTVSGAKAIRHVAGFAGYESLVAHICDFFITHEPPVSKEETIELFAFMEAAHESKRQSGRTVDVQELIELARVQSAREALVP